MLRIGAMPTTVISPGLRNCWRFCGQSMARNLRGQGSRRIMVIQILRDQQQNLLPRFCGKTAMRYPPTVGKQGLISSHFL